MAREAGSRVQFARMDRTEPIIAIGLLTQSDLDLLGDGFRRLFRLDEDLCFEELLAAIDVADLQSQEDRVSPR